MIDLLAIGHVARDEFEDGSWRLGGSALYASVTAAKLGDRTAVVTRVAEREREAVTERCREHGIELVALPANVTTTFSFHYDEAGHRELHLRARAKAIGREDVAGRLRVPRAVVYGSIAHELARDVFDAVVAPVSVLIAQGYLRGWEAGGLVTPRLWEDAAEILQRVTVAVLSIEDLAGDLAQAERWSVHAPVVVTYAERGARLLRNGAAVEIPAYQAGTIVDQTGAGDAFAAGLAVGLSEGRDLEDGVRFANAVASFAVEGYGTDGLADRDRVNARLATGRSHERNPSRPPP